MTGLLFAVVALLAAGVWIARRLRARAARRHLVTGPGTSPEQAIPVRSFAEIDDAIAARTCHCGARLRMTGEGGRQVGMERYRFTRLACDECEEESVLYFDVNEVRH